MGTDFRGAYWIVGIPASIHSNRWSGQIQLWPWPHFFPSKWSLSWESQKLHPDMANKGWGCPRSQNSFSEGPLHDARDQGQEQDLGNHSVWLLPDTEDQRSWMAPSQSHPIIRVFILPQTPTTCQALLRTWGYNSEQERSLLSRSFSSS